MSHTWSSLIACSLILFSGRVYGANVVALPPCGSDPSENTKNLQEQISGAPSNSILVLPPGKCIVAKCELVDSDPDPKKCKGKKGPHSSALYVGNKHHLTIEGAKDGTSELQLDPYPPRAEGVPHPYCIDTHLLSIESSRFIFLRKFTVNGSDGAFDGNQGCSGNDGKVAEQMHGIYIRNSENVSISQMKVTKAHGDGINLFASIQVLPPLTKGVSIVNTRFLDNDRSGITFQRNVRDVLIRRSYFLGSGSDQDIDMEPSGRQEPDNAGPFNVNMDGNLFERRRPGLTVALGSAKTKIPAKFLRFTNNTIRAAADAEDSSQGGCVTVYKSEHVTIAKNRITGADKCIAVESIRSQQLDIDDNELSGSHQGLTEAGGFRPRGVISVSADTAKQDSDCVQEKCVWDIHYADGVNIRRNTITQRVQLSPGIELRGADQVHVLMNKIRSTNSVAPVGTTPDPLPVGGVAVSFGVPALGNNGTYANERPVIENTQIHGNQIDDFHNVVRLAPAQKSTLAGKVSMTRNTLRSSFAKGRGIFVDSDDVLVNSLILNNNRFGCGFVNAQGSLLPNVYVHPPGQPHIGNVGIAIACLQ